MGYYIQVPNPTHKAAQLKSMYDAVIVPQPEGWDEVPEDKALICVIQNGQFDAAAYCYNEREFEEFRALDTVRTDPVMEDHGAFVSINLNSTYQRPRTWLLMDKELARKLSGYKEVR